MACVRSVHDSRILSPKRALNRFTNSLSSGTGPSLGGGGAAGGLAAAAGAAGFAGAAGAGGFGAAAAGFSEGVSPGTGGFFSEGSLAIRLSERAAQRTAAENSKPYFLTQAAKLRQPRVSNKKS